MAQIYQKAKQVIIWLGENFSDVDEAYDTLLKISHALTSFWKADRENESEEILAMRKAAFISDHVVHNLHWDSVATLLKRAWFHRVSLVSYCTNESIS
jgi:Heterokaryon incompatibility protein (HET)